ncbi:Uncharacterised protein [Mycobacterium tuberculosis]|nr:Uncharacterised protein [Mycobacterium tuberculosis]
MKASASTQARLTAGWRLPKYLKTSELPGWIQTVVRPPPTLASSRQLNGNGSPRRSLAVMTSCRCVSARSSISVFTLPS